MLISEPVTELLGLDCLSYEFSSPTLFILSVPKHLSEAECGWLEDSGTERAFSKHLLYSFA